jgi:hypothetical protein
MLGSSSVTAQLAASQEGLSSMKLVRLKFMTISDSHLKLQHFISYHYQKLEKNNIGDFCYFPF